MTVPSGLTEADLDAIEPDWGPVRRYRVTVTNGRTDEREVVEVEAASCAGAKARAAASTTLRLMGDPLLNDVVRLDE